MKYKGLSKSQALKNQSLGLSNSTIDSYVPSYSKIFVKNIFSLINLVITPLLIFLALFGLFNEVLALSIFVVVNTVTSVIDEVRIKRKIEQLKTQFQIKATVIRDEDELEIPISEVVMNDLVVAREGESIIADGIIIESSYLQIDESSLTGESDYLKKAEDAKVFSGSYVITGICYYKVTAIGEQNYTNRLASESTKYQKNKSPLQKAGDKLITILAISAIILGLLNFGLSYFDPNNSMDHRILSLTTIVALIIPQTLIFLFTLTFSISISKLYQKGVLVQKGAAIENLTNIDTLCIDKTGTITTNKMLLNTTFNWNFDEKRFYNFLKSESENLFGVNKTLKVLIDEAQSHNNIKVTNLAQIPFNSKNKYSQFSGKLTNGSFTFVLGAYEAIKGNIGSNTNLKLQTEIKEIEKRGLRALVVIEYREYFTEFPNKKSNNVALFVIEEELNYGIQSILNQFNELGIKLKIISGDSYGSVKSIAARVGLETENIVDLSKEKLKDNKSILDNDIFTRATPDDKLVIINMLKKRGNKVAMVGDGINDVLSLKAADVSISMESGAKVARNISDIVLLNNDYSKLPEIFFEGDNIIYNLKLSTKMFLAKSILAMVLAVFYTAFFKTVPLLPATTLVFSFLGSSLPSYIVIFTRSTIKNKNNFLKEVGFSSIPAGIIMGIASILFVHFMQSKGYGYIEINTGIALAILGLSLVYSLTLLWESNKLKSVGLAIFGFTVAFLAGTMQTLLPLDFNNIVGTELFIVVVISVGVILLGWLLYSKIKPKTLLKKLAVGLATIIWVPVVLVFPFRTYYSTTRLPFELFLSILGLSAIGLIVMLITNFFVQKFRVAKFK